MKPTPQKSTRAHHDGRNFKDHIETTLQTGLTLTGGYGGKAYFRADILNLIKENEALSYIPASASAYKIDKELFSYKKDRDQWFCVMGNETVKVKSRTRERNGKEMKLLEYSFGRELCRNCPRRSECIGKNTRIAKIMIVSVNTPELYEYSQRAKTPEFLKKYRKRAKIEPKATVYKVSAFMQN